MKALHQKVTFLEAENKQLEAQKDNLQETLGINKQILNGVLSGVMNNEEDILGQLQEESDVLIGEIQRMQIERDELSSKVLVLEQINCDLSTKQIEIGQQLDKQVHDLQQQVNVLQYVADHRDKYLEDSLQLLQKVMRRLPSPQTRFAKESKQMEEL